MKKKKRKGLISNRSATGVGLIHTLIIQGESKQERKFPHNLGGGSGQNDIPQLIGFLFSTLCTNL